MSEKRRILLLQGPASWFFAKLGRELSRSGASVFRITFCPGDRLFWWRKSGKAIAFRQPRHLYAAFLSDLIVQQKITDIVCLGDSRFWHKTAIELCATQRNPPRVHIVEHGYIRAGWLTFERDGINANSRITRDPDKIIKLAANIETQSAVSTGGSFFTYALMDIAWNLSNVLIAPFTYGHFKTHAIDHPLSEWLGWIGKWSKRKRTRKSVKTGMAKIAAHNGPVFLFPLQLAGDYQIRTHGPKSGLIEALRDTIKNFGDTAPENALLVIKIHPLDNGRTDWQNIIRKAANANGCEGRCLFLGGGDLDAIMARSIGCVTVNSTVGLNAILSGVATFTLGDAIYNINGLVNSGSLSEYWQAPQRPNESLAHAFRRLLIDQTQIDGAFDGKGAGIGAANIAAKITRSNSR